MTKLTAEQVRALRHCGDVQSGSSHSTIAGLGRHLVGLCNLALRVDPLTSKTKAARAEKQLREITSAFRAQEGK